MKRAILIVAAAMTLFTHSLAQAQEREPLVMRIELEWTVAGTVFGALIGAALWLTDPGNPNNALSRSVLEGSALGAVAGAGFGIYVIQRNVQYPAGLGSTDPLDPMNRLGNDPVEVLAKRSDLLAGLNQPAGSKRGYEITLANFNWRF